MSGAEFTKHSDIKCMLTNTDIRMAAADIIAADNNRLKISAAVALSFLFFTLPVYVTLLFWDRFIDLMRLFFVNEHSVSIAANIFVYTIAALAVTPAFFGIFILADEMQNGSKVHAAVFLRGYRRALRSIAVFVISLLPIIIAVGAVILCGSVFDLINESDIPAAFASLLFLATPVCTAFLLLIALYFAVRGFFFAGLAARPDINPIKALCMSYRLSRNRTKEIIRFLLSFSGWAALSLLSFGILFIIHFVPLYSVSYMIFCGRAALEGEK